MIRRLFWMLVGVSVGVWSTLRFQRRVRESAERYAPEQLARDAADRARSVRDDLRDAVSEGRRTMEASEAELRADFDLDSDEHPPSLTS